MKPCSYCNGPTTPLPCGRGCPVCALQWSPPGERPWLQYYPSGPIVEIGDWVVADCGDSDSDYGQVLAVPAEGVVLVGWQSGVQTPADIARLAPYANEADARTALGW